MEENPLNERTNITANDETLKNITDMLKEVEESSKRVVSDEDLVEPKDIAKSSFKKVDVNLPEKTGFWTKLKNILLYEIKVELTPYQQKIEGEINDFLHQEITWKSLKEAALSDVPITFRGKRVF